MRRILLDQIQFFCLENQCVQKYFPGQWWSILNIEYFHMLDVKFVLKRVPTPTLPTDREGVVLLHCHNIANKNDLEIQEHYSPIHSRQGGNNLYLPHPR